MLAVLLLHDALTDGQETEPSACQGGLTGDDSGGSFHLDSNYGHHTDDCTYLLSCPVSHTSPPATPPGSDSEESLLR